MIKRSRRISYVVAAGAVAVATALAPVTLAGASNPAGNHSDRTASQFAQIGPNLWVARAGPAVTYKSDVTGSTVYYGVATPGELPLGVPMVQANAVPGLGNAAPSIGSTSIRPLNATGWSGDVYIHIYSVGTSGPKIRSWWTSTVTFAGPKCSHSDFWRGNGNTLYQQWGTLCIPAGQSQYFYTQMTFPNGKIFNGQTLCNTWSYIPGKPCEHVS